MANENSRRLIGRNQIGMDYEKVFDGVRECLCFVMELNDEEKGNIANETTVSDLKKWNSVNHIKLIFELEKQFNIEFDPFDAIEIVSVEAIVNALQRKLK